MAKHVPLSSISQDDMVIALMGPTGTGKSRFIDVATLQDGDAIGHSLGSCTSGIRAIRFPHPTTGRPFVLVDTPGFNNTTKTDTEVLTMIAGWLGHTYKNQVKLTGIIYLHRISDNRMASAPLKNLHMFTKLCGDNALKHVVIATTMWGQVETDIGIQREDELRDRYWGAMLQRGSQALRFTDSFSSAWNIIDSIVKHTGDTRHVLLLQEELVDLHRRLNETQAGMALHDGLQKALVQQRETIRRLREEASAQHNELAVGELTAQYERIQEELETTFGQLEEMKVSLGTHVKLWLTFRKTHSRPAIV